MSTTQGTQPAPPTAAERNRAALAERDRQRAGARNVQRAKSFKSLRTAADLAQVVGWFVALGGIVIGAMLALHSDTATFGPDEHPYIGVGVGLAVGGVLVGVLFNLLANWALAWIVQSSD